MYLVAKSYQELEQVGEPFNKGQKQYIKVKTKSGSFKEVRIYTEKEYNKMYPETKVKTIYPYEKVFGFPITIFPNAKNKHQEWFELSVCRYSTKWGWYLVSADEMPQDLPKDLKPIILTWDMCRDGDELKSNEKLKEVIRNASKN